MFDEAERRDPDHHRVWVALVDGANHQLDRIRAEATARNINVRILIDFVQVIEYLLCEADAALAALVERFRHVPESRRR